jgi:hypothetical protein
MKNKKKFDCVKMKWDIQRKLDEEFSKMSEDEAIKTQKKRISDNPILGTFFNKLGKVSKKGAALINV